jgi:uncharacterized membrane protein
MNLHAILARPAASWTKRKSTYLSLLTVVLLLVGASVALAREANNQPVGVPEAGQKVEQLVFDQIGESGQTDFFVWLTEKADLSGAAQLATKEEKGQFVFDALRETAERTQEGVLAALDTAGVEYRSYYIANKVLVRAGGTDLVNALAGRSDVERITANHVFQLPEPIISPRPRDESPQVIEPNLIFVNADDVWALGYDGAGILLAGNDTGLDWDHPALIDHYRGWNGSSADHNYNWWDATGTYPTVPDDGHGHGTHTTGTMVGDDGATHQIGMAPGAQTIHCKNMDNGGSGSEATFTECFEWDLAPWDLTGANPDPNMAPDAINNSWGFGGGNFPAFEDEIAALQAAGIAVEVSAGNEGDFGCTTLRSPGDYDQVITTGSVNHAGGVLPGTLTSFSSRGPSLLYPSIPMPDIMAPGENINSSLPGGGYSGPTWSGTSMAGPHVTALIGLMWSAAPGLRGDIAETYDAIYDTAVRLTGQPGWSCGGDYTVGPNNDWGYGTIDALAAVEEAIIRGGPFQVVATPEELGVCAPDDALYDIDVLENVPYSFTVDLSLSGHPGGTSYSFVPDNMDPPYSSVLTVSGTGSAAPGSYLMTVTGTGSDPLPEVATEDVMLNVYDDSPGAPTLVSPANGATGVALVPTYEWSAASQGGSYYIEVATDSGFTNVIDSATVSGLTYESGIVLDVLTTYYWHVQASNDCGTGSFSSTFSFTTREVPPILLVDDDDNFPDVQAYYTDALNSLGAAYDIWDTGGTDTEPSSGDLAPYSIVIWFTGVSFGGFAGPGPTAEGDLGAWLDGGGCMFISSQDYHYDRGLTAFMDTYLGVSFVSDDVGQSSVTGAGSVYGGFGPYTLSYPFTNFSDLVNPDGDAELAWSGNVGDAAVDKDAAVYKTTFWGFPFEALPDDTARTDTMEATLTWCGGLGPTGTLAGNVSDGDSGLGIEGASVTADTTGYSRTVSTDAAGDYSMNVPIGTYDVTASADNYTTEMVTGVVVITDTTTTQDFVLFGSQLTYSPPEITENMSIGDVVSNTVTVTNSGPLPIDWEVSIGNYGGPTAARAAGTGEWLYRSTDGVELTVNDGAGGTRTAYPAAYRWTPDNPSSLQSILVYTDDFIHTFPNTLVDQALQSLGLAYTAHYEGDFAGFEADLAGGSWDLVIYANDNYQPLASTFTALNSYVLGGGTLVLHTWGIGQDPGNALWDLVGISSYVDDFDPPDPVYWWEGDHQVFNDPEVVPEFTSLTSGIYGTYGQHVTWLPDFTPLAGYTTTPGVAGEGAMILGNEGRTLYRAFLDGQNSADLDTDGKLDGVELWINTVTGALTNFSGGAGWAMAFPESGTIPAGDTATFEVGFHAESLYQVGTYTAELSFSGTFVNEPPIMPLTMILDCPTCGFLQGAITDAGTGDPLTADIHVTGPGGFDVTITGDTYDLAVVPGTYDFEVTASGYLTGTAQVTVAQGQTVVTDFALIAAEAILEYSPPEITEDMSIGDVVSNTVTVTNTGTIPMDWEVSIGNYGGPGFVTVRQLDAPAPTSAPSAPSASLRDSGTAGVSGERIVGSPAAPEDILIDQQPNGSNGIFSDVSCDLCGGPQVLAESFILDGTATIGQIVFWTGYFPGDVPIDPDHFTVIFHEDSGGFPGATISTETEVPSTREQTGLILFGVHEYIHTLTLAAPVTLDAGTYFVEIYNDTGFGTDDFFWEVGNTDPVHGQVGSAFAFEAPGSSWNYDFGQDLSLQLITGTPGGGWAQAAPTGGTIPPGDSATFEVGFHAESLYQVGTYTAELSFSGTFGNDPPIMPLTMNLDCPTCGFLEGAITDAGTGDPLTADIHVTGPGGFDVTISGDTYDLAVVPGTYDFEVAAEGYLTETAQVTVAQGQTVVTDFALIAAEGMLEYSPPEITETMGLGQLVTNTVTITNTGTIPLNWEVDITNFGGPSLGSGSVPPFVSADLSATPASGLVGSAEANISGTRAPSESPAGQEIILDQAPNGINGYFADAGCELCGTGQQSIAENFMVEGDVAVGQIVFWTGYFPGDVPIDPDHLMVIFHEDSAGSPGATIYTEADVAYEREQTGVILFGVHEWIHTLTLADPVPLSAGNYWLEIFNDTGFGNDQFFWETGNQDPVHGLPNSAWSVSTPGSAWNIQADNLSVQLITGETGPEWAYAFPTTGSLDPGESDTFSVVFDSTVVTDTGQYTADLEFSGDFVNEPPIMPLTMNIVEGAPGVDLSDPQEGSGTAGTSVNYEFTVENTGDIADTFDLAISGNTWPTTVDQASVTLSVGEVTTVTVTVDIPGDIADGDMDEATLTATSQYDGSVSDSTTATTTGYWNKTYMPLVRIDADSGIGGVFGVGLVLLPLAGLGALPLLRRRR